jgi:hypothetical protein
VKDHAERGPLAGAHGRDAVAHLRAVVAALPQYRALARREDQERAALD